MLNLRWLWGYSNAGVTNGIYLIKGTSTNETVHIRTLMITASTQ